MGTLTVSGGFSASAASATVWILSATSNVSTASLYNANQTTTNIVATNISTSTLISSTVASNVMSATTITGTNLSLSGNLNVAGTLTTVNITSTNLVNTNVSAGVVVASTLLSARGNSNTIGNIYTTSGNVGIGTVNPSSRLHISGNGGGNIIFEGSDHVYLQLYPFGFSSGRKAYIGFPDANNKSLHIFNEATAGNITLTNSAGGSVRLFNENTIALTATGGNVGVGTTSPSYRLDVSGDIRTFVNNTRSSLYLGNGTFDAAINLWDIAGAAWQVRTGGYSFMIGNGTIGSTINNQLTIVSSGNVGIGTNAPGTRLDVNGAGTIRGNLYVNSGSLGGLPTLNVSPSSNGAESSIGFWQNTANAGASWVVGHNTSGVGNNNFGIYSGTYGGNTLSILNSGNVGIGTNSPAYKLDVNGVIKNNADIIMDSSGRLTLYNNTGGLQVRSGSTNILWLNQDNGGNISMVGGGGNVGINTSSPTTAKLVISGSAGAIGLDLSSSDQYAEMRVIRNSLSSIDKDMWLQHGAGSGSKLRLYSNNTETMLLNSGNVGIGTTPSAKLHVFEASGTAAGANSGSIILDHDNSGGASSITFRSKVNRSSDYAYIQYQDAASVGGGGETARFIIGVQNDGDDHIVLDPSGGVGIGTYSPGFKLQVNGNMRADNIYNNGWFRNYGDQGLYNEDYGCNFVRNDAQYGNWRIYGNNVNNWNGIRFTQAEISLMAGDGATKTCGFHYNGTGWGMLLDSSRNLFVPGNITAYWSDRRLKTNLQQLSNFDNVLTSLTGYSFNWNEKGQEILQKPSDETEIGLIAQDVQAVIPQAVTINKAGQKLDDPEPFEYLTINYDKIIPFLVEGYKAQRGEIQAQRGEIDELKSKIQHLEQLINKLT